jgi:alanine racemase
MTGNTQVTVDLDALAGNIGAAREVLRPETALIFVVKANAYGHGMAEVARRAAQAGVGWFGVAHAHEAIELRGAVGRAKILLVGVAQAEDVPGLIESDVVPVVVDEDQAATLAAAARRMGKTLAVHLKIDTGMGRLGVLWERAVDVHQRLMSMRGIELQGLCTHFASVEIRRESAGPEQLHRFQSVAGQIEARERRRLFKHVSSSRALQYHADWDLDGVRPGIVLYGYGSKEAGMRVRTRPVLQWTTRVMQVKDVPAGFPVGYYGTYTTPAATRIATVAAGYADGYHRALGNKGLVLIRGRRCAVVGRISMNWITVDVGPGGEAARGDEAVLIGEQGVESVWADELARLARTIPYEILTSIHASAERVYVQGAIDAKDPACCSRPRLVPAKPCEAG